MSGGSESARRINTTALFAPVARIDQHLARFVADLGRTTPKNLHQAVEYAVMGGGKRLRPLLAWYWCEALGAPGEASLAAGTALELVHSFSLVHDDLPALDNDDLRRGKPTVHRQFGEAMAILTGDALLNLAQLALSRVGDEHVQPLMSFCLATATQRMIAGQVYDTLGGFEEHMPPEDRVVNIHFSKTAALIAAACMLGHFSGFSWCAKAGRPGGFLKTAPGDYGEAIGLMFQIVDDLLDVTQTAEKAGKRTGKDAAAGKLTYPGVMGIEASRREVDRLKLVALKVIEPLGPPAQPLRDLCDYLCVRTQ